MLNINMHAHINHDSQHETNVNYQISGRSPFNLIYLGFFYGVTHLGGGHFCPPLFKIRNNGPKSIKTGRKAENHVKSHKITLNFRKHKFYADVSTFCAKFVHF